MDDCPAGIVESLSIRNGQLIEDRHYACRRRWPLALS